MLVALRGLCSLPCLGKVMALLRRMLQVYQTVQILASGDEGCFAMETLRSLTMVIFVVMWRCLNEK